MTEPAPGPATAVHSATTYHAPGATGEATTDLLGLTVQRETDVNPSLPETTEKPPGWGIGRGMR